MKLIYATSTVLRLLTAAFAVTVATTAPLRAADWSPKVFAPPASFTTDIGVRFWYGRVTTAKDLFDVPGSAKVSRLTYSDLNLYAGEAFSRMDFNSGWFLKGYFGLGGLWNGRLKDEDFEPFIVPYSATTSQQREGSLIYGSGDLGFKLVRGPDFHVGMFAGYHFLRDSVQAFGCGQIASNPSVCGGGIPDAYRVITQHNTWQALRVGLEAAYEIDNRWKFSIDGAYLPYVWLAGSDTHWLRLGNQPGDFGGPIPEDGNGWGYQVDAFIAYRLTEALSLGLGGRYWHVQSSGLTHFDGHVVGFAAAPQPVNWKADHFGVFLQSSLKFGPYPLFFGGN